VRFQPLLAPILHEINVYVHYFFVPYRLLWDGWEDYITGGVDGDDAQVLPRWEPTLTTVGSLWDYMGFPVGVDPAGAYPMDFPRRAYNAVFNQYYRDETLDDEVAETNETILRRRWEKDYFASALPWQQRGTAPALPISGTTSAIWADSIFSSILPGTPKYPLLDGVNSDNKFHQDDPEALANLKGALNANSVDLSSATTFDVADLRLAFQIQKWMERNARAGARYVEFLQSHFAVHPRDERLQRPEYIGGTKAPVIVSEVLQTSSTDGTSPQGNLAGHGISASSQEAANYSVEEYGLIIGIMSIMPRAAYQQGIDRQWLRRSRYDFYFPEFANLSEQAIERAEIYASGVEAENRTIFGYQGRYDEMRVKRSQVCGQMRETFKYWHLGRQFTTAPELNSTFLECNPRKDIFAVPAEPGLIVSVGNVIKGIRPLPSQSEPGLIDHS